MTGNASLEVDLRYKSGEALEGDLRFNIKEGELVPIDSLINIDYGSQSKQIPLSSLVRDFA
jgi:hypothetical protein